MPQYIPAYLPPFMLLSTVALVSVLLLSAWRAVGRSRPEDGRPLVAWLWLAGPLLIWVTVAVLVAQANVFMATPAGRLPATPMAILPPILLALGWLMTSHRAKQVLQATPVSWLVRIQVFRVIGANFLVLWWLGLVPGEFALPAGLGDLLVGLLAFPVAARLDAGDSGAVAAARWWNIFGVLDLVVAVGAGFLTAPGPFQQLAIDRPNVLVTAYPLVLIPVFLVPLSIILHSLSMWQLNRITARSLAVNA